MIEGAFLHQAQLLANGLRQPCPPWRGLDRWRTLIGLNEASLRAVSATYRMVGIRSPHRSIRT